MRAHRGPGPRFRGIPRTRLEPDDDPKNEFETEADLDAEEAEEEGEVMTRAEVEPFTTTFPAPPHPRSVFRYLKQAFREYLASGNASNINVTTPPGQAHTAALTVSGSVEMAAGLAMPAAVTVVVTQASVVLGTQSALVDPVTGVYSTTFPANTCAAGSTTATASTAPPYPTETTTTPAFTLT